MRRFRDRDEAGEVLGLLLAETIGTITEGIVLGLPRGGVPVAARVATRFGLPLDVFIVRKLGLPRREEYAMGAIASGGVVVLDESVVRRFGISDADVTAVMEREAHELARREEMYRGDRPALDLEGRRVILVDDGVATGSSMRAAIEAVKAYEPSELIVAVPVAPRSAAAEFDPLVDRFIVALTPRMFQAVGLWYDDFTQTSDRQVQALLRSDERN
jgi:predicted phosphoribosyltransferase